MWLATLSRASLVPLAAAGGAVLANLAIKAWRWRWMVRQALGVELRFGEALAMIPVGVAAGALIPGHAVDLGKPAMLAIRHGVALRPAVGLGLWERLFDFGALLVLAGLAGLTWSTAKGGDTLFWPLAFAGVAGAVATALAVVPGAPLRLAERLLGAVPAATPGRRAAIAGASVAALAVETVRAALVASALHWGGPSWNASAAFLIGSLAGVASLIPGGLGVAEWSTAAVLSRWAAPDPGVRPLSEAAAIVLLDRLLAYYTPAIVGAVVMALWSRGRPSGAPRLVAATSDEQVARRAQESGEGPEKGGLPWVVLPAYNEARDIGRLIRRVAAALSEGPYRVVLVDDGSDDATVSEAHDAARQTGAPLVVLRHPRNLGLPAALRTGLKWVAERAGPGDAIVCMDADNTQDPAVIPRMLRTLREGYDVIIGSRYRRGAGEVGVPLGRRVLSRGVNLLLRVLAPVPGVRDYTCGFRAYRAAVVRAALRRFGDGIIESRTFACTAELLLRLDSIGCRVGEVPLTLRYDMKRGKSKIRILPTIWEYLRLTARLAPANPRTFRRMLWAAALVLFTVPVAAPLTDGDSHYYAAIAQEMLRTGDWLTPRHPEAPGAIVDKPPLTLWAMAASFRLLGVHEVAARIWQVLLGLGVLWLTVDTGRMYLPERTAVKAGWILLTSALFWYAVLVPQQDVATIAFLCLAVWGILRLRYTGRVRYWYVTCAALAGELLSRGILGLALVGAILAAYLVLVRGAPLRLFAARPGKAVHLVLGIALFAALGLPWFVAEARVLGSEFLEVFFGRGNTRFFSGQPAASGPALVLGYAVLLAGACLPWAGWLPSSVGWAVGRLRTLTGAEAEAHTLVVAWAVVAFILPHLMAWRVIRYMLPVLPAAGLLIADWADASVQGGTPASAAPVTVEASRRLTRAAYGLTLVLLAPLAAGALALPWVSLPAEGEPLRPFAQVLLAIFAAGTAAYAWWGRPGVGRGGRVLAATALAAFLALGAAVAGWGSHAFPVRLGAG